MNDEVCCERMDDTPAERAVFGGFDACSKTKEW
jgi:hypothetical protein